MTKGFKRGILEKTKEKAQDFFKNSKSGEAILEGVNKGDLIVCIRDDYFNVYRNGCSILKYAPNATENKFIVHRKYFPEPEIISGCGGDKNYASIKLEKVRGKDQEIESQFIDEIVIEPNENLKRYLWNKNQKVASEKELLQKYVERTTPCLVDLEVTFTVKEKNKEGKVISKAKRIDFAQLIEKEDGVWLQLVEAKVVTDSRLKAENTHPEIFGQMLIYEGFIKSESKNIKDSYQSIAKNFVEDFPYFIVSESHKKLMSTFITKPQLMEKPKLLLLSSGEDIKAALKGQKGLNAGDHFKTIKDECEAKGWSLELWKDAQV